VIIHLETMQEAYANPVPTGAQMALVSADFGNRRWEALELLRRIRGQAPETKIILFANTRMRETVGSYLEKVRAGKVWADSTEVGWITEALME
jgi:hypothetical protein